MHLKIKPYDHATTRHLEPRTMNTAFHADNNNTGLPWSYALYQMPGDAEGTHAVIRVLNVPDANERNETHQTQDMPLHLCDPSKLVTHHRLGNHDLPFRTIDPRVYDQSEIDWYETGVLPPPLYMCFIHAFKCYLCGDIQASSDDIECEMTENFKEGYRFCTKCAPYVRRALYKTLAPIWRFRLQHERSDRGRTPIWVHRTRRDESGKSDRTNSGRPFRYTRWYVSSWIPRKSMNRHVPTVEPFEEDLICVEEWNSTDNMEPMSKLVSVMDVFFANRGSLHDPSYDPNADDPLNQVRHLTIDEKREIMRQESPPFE